MSSNVKLSWAGFSARSPQTLQGIWEEKDFTDVTLVTEDGTQILSHQVILGSASVFFKRILRMTSNQDQQRPFLFLSGLKGSLVASLVDFIYLGECEVEEEDIDQFFKTGRDLAVQGIDEVALEDGYQEEEDVVAKHNKVEDTTSPSLLQVALEDGEETLAEEHPLKVEVEEEETIDDDFGFAMNALDKSYESHAGSPEDIQENPLVVEDPTPVLDNFRENTKTCFSEAHPDANRSVNIRNTFVGAFDLLDSINDDNIANEAIDAAIDAIDNNMAFDGAEGGNRVINPFHNLVNMTGILPSEIVTESQNDKRLSDSEIDELLKDTEEILHDKDSKPKDKRIDNVQRPHDVTPKKPLKVDVKKTHLPNEKFPIKLEKLFCVVCSFSTYRQHHLNQHRAEKHEGRMYNCNQCGFKAAYSSQLSRHKSEKHMKRRLKCDHCDYTTSRRDNMSSHRCRQTLYRVNLAQSKREATYNFKI